MLPNERPCENCIHKKVCEATKKFDEINIELPHPFFKAKIECIEFIHKPTGLMKKADAIYSPSDEMHKAIVEEKA